MTTWQGIKKDLVGLVVITSGGSFAAMLLFVLWDGLIFPSEREGTIETAGCRVTIIHKKRPILDAHAHTCVYDRRDSKNPDRITARYCARVETESGICTLAEIYSDAVPGSSIETPTGRP